MREYKILWIDDDINNPELRPERDALEERCCIITPVTNPDDLDYDEITYFDCIIIDLSLPTGYKLSLPETAFGTRAGLAILKKIKQKSSHAKTIVYTVFDALDARDYCCKNRIPYWNKSEYLADDFADAVIKEINK